MSGQLRFAGHENSLSFGFKVVIKPVQTYDRPNNCIILAHKEGT